MTEHTVLKVTEWGVHYTWEGGDHITWYGATSDDERRARTDAQDHPTVGQAITLVNRVVTYGTWQSVDTAWFGAIGDD